jgi:hypothetical protein
MIVRALPFFLLAILTLGQEHNDLFDKAPPAVEAALRARVNEFYQDHVQGKFRAADALVAEDSKDAFFAMEKTKYKKCEVGKLTFSDNFTKAIAVTSCQSSWSFNGVRIPAMLALSSYWKFENANWYWYAPPPETDVMTPFGKFHVDPDADSKSPLPSNPVSLAGGILSQVKADRNALTFTVGQAADQQVRITNHMPGLVRLTLQTQDFPGLHFSLDKTSLAANETATLTVAYEPSSSTPAPDLTVNIAVSPTQQLIPIHIGARSAAPPVAAAQ